MTAPATDLLTLARQTHALTIWDRTTGPVFWYAANVPGPFYFNTEKLIGGELADRMLAGITANVAENADASARAAKLHGLIMPEFEQNAEWRHLVDLLIARAGEAAPGGFDLVSGGERRDWLFSIPFAAVSGKPHLYLFKNGESFCAEPAAPGRRALHVSDLINNAASILDAWLPMLDRLGVACAGNLCVTIRGHDGMKRLEAAGQTAHGLMRIDTAFFAQMEAKGLIDAATLEELDLFFGSARDWAVRYLVGKPDVFEVARSDAKSIARLRTFLASDPWQLRADHAAFFAAMDSALAVRG